MTVEKARDQTVDIAKGMAIVAIVLGHVLRGLGSAGLIDSMSAAFVASDRALYMAHLTVFAFLSGLFVARGVEKNGTASYLRIRLGNFLYLYLVWQTLQVLVKLGTASLVNNAPDTGALLEIWIPEGQMWFLPWLILATIAAVLFKPWRNTAAGLAGIAVVSIISLAAWGFEGRYAGTQGLSLLVFFVIGARLRFDRLSAALAGIRAPGLAVLAAASAAVYYGVLVWTGAVPPTVNAAWRVSGVAFGVLGSTAGLVSVLTACALAARFRFGFGWMAFVGRRSLEVFLVHIIAASGTRIVLEKLGVEDPAVHIAAGMVGGIVGALLLWWVLARMGFIWLFQRPVLSRKPAAVPHGEASSVVVSK